MTFVRFGSLMMRVEEIKSVVERPAHKGSSRIFLEDGSWRDEDRDIPCQCEITIMSTGSRIYVNETLDCVEAKIAEALGK